MNIKCSHTKNLNIIVIITMIRIKSIRQKLAKVKNYFKVLVQNSTKKSETVFLNVRFIFDLSKLQ